MSNNLPPKKIDWTPTEVKRLREAATYEHAGCTASAMGWAIKYANIHELALRLVQAKGRFHTQKAFKDLSEFISSENAGGMARELAAQDSESITENGNIQAV